MEHCSQATVIFALVLVHVFVILALVVAWACAWLGPGVFAASSTLVLTLLLALVGIPESGTGVAPGRIHRSLGAALLVLLTAAATFYPWEKNGSGGIATCLEEGAEVPYFDGSPWYFGKDALMCWLHALLAALCLSMPHPNSRYARVVVWAVVAIWLETYCWLVANTYWLCLAMPGHGDKLFRDLVRSFGFNLDVLGQAWTAVLLLRRVRAVESSFGESVGAWKLQWLLFVGTLTSTVAAFLLTWINVAKGTNFPGQLQRPLVTDIFYFISSAIWFLCGFTFSYAFTTPCVLLKQEAKSLESAPLAEALWAARRLKVERAASMTTSFLTSLNFMGRAVCGIWSKQMPVPVWFFLDVLMWDFDDLANAISLAVLSGLLYQDRPPELQKPENDCDLKDNCRSCDCCGGNEADWQVKVHELASRSVGVLELVNFVQKLKEPSLMPSFLPEMSTTNDVVRQAIIPLSRRGDTGFALASLWSGGAPRPPTKMVTHAWDNTFSHLVASIVADAMGVATYSGIAAQLCSERLPEVVEDLEQLHRRSQYWICAFCINQHSCICSGFGAEPIFGTPQFDEWDTKRRDTVTGDVYPLCRCSHPKYFNSSPNECEMNKFDDMIHLLHCEIPDFILVASVDYYFQIFMRAWCVAELVEAETCGISSVMKIHSEELLDHYYNELSRLDVRACKASRAEDKAMILYRIRNVDAFNARLQWLIFGSQGSSLVVSAALQVEEGDTVLDACANGITSLVLAGGLFPRCPRGQALPHDLQGRLVCNEMVKSKASRLQQTMHTLLPWRLFDVNAAAGHAPRVVFTSVDMATTSNAAERLGPYDKILLGPPCTEDKEMLRGSAPGGLSKWSAATAKVNAERQLKWLHNSLWLLREGGVVLYFTRALSVEEGDGVIQRLFQRVEGLFDLQVMPLEELVAGFVPGLSAEPTDWGARIMPDKTSFGPMFFSRLRLLRRRHQGHEQATGFVSLGP